MVDLRQPPPDQPPPVPPRARRTHLNPAVEIALRGLSLRQKKEENSEIEKRNETRAGQRLRHARAPEEEHDASDDESLITVPPDVNSPSRDLAKDIQAMSPDTGARLLKHMLALQSSKRAGSDDEDEPKTDAKKPRVPVKLTPGMALPLVFNDCLLPLLKFGVYMPASLFTTRNLEYINANANSLLLVSLNPVAGVKKPKVINVEDLLRRLGLQEEDMTRDQWTEAVMNMVDFVARACGEGSVEHERLKEHFGFFANMEDAETTFPAALATDIKLRKTLNTLFFEYEITYYSNQLQKAVWELMLQTSKATPPAPLQQQQPPKPSCTPSSSRSRWTRRTWFLSGRRWWQVLGHHLPSLRKKRPHSPFL
ncbi:hypothetical protein C8F01DRAFT_1094277 [Mycena amicta]|nr:hypothetical protein C8F01DRAFT_1094277 [Mycena amicta]